MAPRQTPRHPAAPMTPVDSPVRWMAACLASAEDVIRGVNGDGKDKALLGLADYERIHRELWQTRVRLLHLTRLIAPSHSFLDQLVTEASWVFRQAPDSGLVGVFTFAIAVGTLFLPSEARLSLERATGTKFEVEVVEERLAEAGDGEGSWIPRPSDRSLKYDERLQARRVPGKLPLPRRDGGETHS